MQTDQNQVAKLIAFKQRDKFSTKSWNDRGLNPSGSETCQKLENLFNSCADNLIAAIDRNASNKQLKLILRNSLSSFNKHDYDTEEKEFICDVFFELTTITKIDFKDTISTWLYGSTITTLSKIYKFLRPEKIIETIRQPCNSCGIELATYIMQKEKGIPDSSWFIIKCNNCNEFNLMSPGQGVKEIKYGNYKWAETLSKQEYTLEQAMIRLEQIKFFRK